MARVSGQKSNLGLGFRTRGSCKVSIRFCLQGPRGCRKADRKGKERALVLRTGIFGVYFSYCMLARIW